MFSTYCRILFKKRKKQTLGEFFESKLVVMFEGQINSPGGGVIFWGAFFEQKINFGVSFLVRSQVVMNFGVSF